jgi:uncharacterized membrane protein YhhN
MKKLFLFLFLIAAAVHLIAEFFPSAFLHNISKPLLMIALGGYYFVRCDERSVVTIGAILFSLIGDVLLLDDSNFMLGLIAFLLAHVFYIFSYRQHRFETDVEALQGVQRVRIAFPVVLAGTGLVVILYPKLDALRVPVIIYAGVITTMVLTALFRFGRTNARSFWMVFAGAVLFMISDSVLAVNKFLEPLSRAGFWIMLTYIAGQYLIVEGLIAHAARRKA